MLPPEDLKRPLLPQQQAQSDASGSCGPCCSERCCTYANMMFAFMAQLAGSIIETAETVDTLITIGRALRGQPALEKAFFGIFTIYGAVPGIAIGLLCAVGSTYLHMILNKNNENLVNVNLPLHTKYFFFPSDWTAHFIEFIVPFSTIIMLVNHLAEIPSPFFILGLVTSVIVAAIGAYADHRTCQNGVRKQITSTTPPDCKTIANSALTFLTLTLASLDLAFLMDEVTERIIEKIYNYGTDYEMEKIIFGLWSGYGFAFGLFFGICAAVGSAYCHYYLNKENQPPTPEQATALDHYPLSRTHKTALAGDRISHINEISVALIIFIKFVGDRVASAIGGNLTHQVALRSVQLVLQLGSYGIGWWSSHADYRTCKNNLVEYNKQRLFPSNAGNHVAINVNARSDDHAVYVPPPPVEMAIRQPQPNM